MMERKIVFLDIDGVLQKVSSQERFEHINNREPEKDDMPMLYRRLEYQFKIDFKKYNRYDVAAVYYDWHKTSVELLKLTLSLIGAQIVLSSDWRLEGFERMKDFFTIHGLQNYFVDMTDNEDKIDKTVVDEIRNKCLKEIGKDAYISHRTIEILEWLGRNPDVKKWVAIDDMGLEGLGKHFVRTNYRYTWKEAEKCIRLLSD